MEAVTMNTLSRFIKDDNGADLVEYALIIGLVSLAAVGASTTIVDGIGQLFNNVNQALKGVVITTPKTGS
jgi:pilus assembly protein Flp/PilA